MKEHGILFREPMVRAILAGEKTQTRRKMRVPEWWPDSSRPGTMPRDAQRAREHRLADMLNEQAHKTGWPAVGHFRDGRPDHVMRCPYGGVGARLWVRETHQLGTHNGDAERRWVRYRATDETATPKAQWRPSIFMPRWASRITLEVVGVRVERVQDISEADARAEGVAPAGGFMATSGCWTNYGKDGPSFHTARESFASLWSSINGAESWDADPFVWVIEFGRGMP